MTTNDEPLTRNYDSEKEKVKSTATLAFKKLDTVLLRIRSEENMVKLSVSIDRLLCDLCRLTLFCYLLFSSFISRHALCRLWSRAQNSDLIFSRFFLSVFPCRTL